MGVGSRARLKAALMARGWSGDMPAAIVCAASRPNEWCWTGTLTQMTEAEPPEGVAGVIVVGEVVRLREALTTASEVAEREVGGDNEVSYVRSR